MAYTVFVNNGFTQYTVPGRVEDTLPPVGLSAPVLATVESLDGPVRLVYHVEGTNGQARYSVDPVEICRLRRADPGALVRTMPVRAWVN